MTQTNHDLKRLLEPAVVAVLFVVLFLQLSLSVRQQTQTFDEGFHLVAGYRYWQCGDFGINSEHPPLVKMVAAAPLWLGHSAAPAGDCGHEPTTKDYGYGLGINYLYSDRHDADTLLLRGRLAASIFGLLLAAACYFGARTLFGPAAALISLIVVAFEPNVLAHGALITTDAAVSAFMLLAVIGFYRCSSRPTLLRVAAAGIFAGLALSSKHSGVLIVPILLLLVAVEFVTNKPRPSTLLATLVAVLAIALVVLWGNYRFRFAARPHAETMTTSLPDFLSAVQQQGTTGIVVTHVIPTAARWHLLPQAYLYGFVDVLSITHPGQPPFILGTLYPHGRWFYFPVAFLIKSTLGFLALLAGSLMLWPIRAKRREVLYLTIPLAVILIAGMASGLNIGYRHVLPIVGFLCVLIGGTAAALWRRGIAWQVAVVLLLGWHVVSSARAFPNYIPYSNEAWGGPSRTYKFLTDANVDWGQAVKQLATYLQREKITDCWIGYDGALSLQYYGIGCRSIPGNGTDAPRELPPDAASGTFILSDLTWSGIEFEPGELHPYRAFQQAQPVAVVGGAMLVYRGAFDLKGAQAVSHVARANQLLDAGKCDAAIAEAKPATALIPHSVRAHLAYGRALAACHSPAAQMELETALNLANAKPEWYPIEIAQARRELTKLASTAQ